MVRRIRTDVRSERPSRQVGSQVLLWAGRRQKQTFAVDQIEQEEATNLESWSRQRRALCTKRKQRWPAVSTTAATV